MDTIRSYSELIGSEPHLVLTQNGFTRVHPPRIEHLGDGQEQLEALANKSVSKIDNIGRVSSCPVHLRSWKREGRSEYAAIVELKKLRFNTSYAVAEVESDKWLYPTFSRGSQGASFSLDWRVPDHMLLCIAFYISGEWAPDAKRRHNVASSLSYKATDCYLYAQPFDKEKEDFVGTYILPTGNVYDNGRVCFGEAFQSEASLLACVDANLDTFYSTPWNADLTSGDRVENAKKMFRFHHETNEQLGSGGGIDELIYFNNTHLNKIL